MNALRVAWALMCAVTLLASSGCVDAAKVTHFSCDDGGRCAGEDAGTCGPQSCAGCCEGATCRAGTESSACGTGGATCARCAAGQGCAAGACGGARPDGQACGGDGECASRHCAAGFCCEAACTGGCETCAVPGKEGQCLVRPAASACGDFVCDGSSRQCPTSCTTAAQCGPGRTCEQATHVCADLDECAQGSVCGPNAVCTNTPGTFTCACAPGFSGGTTQGTATTCGDVDECAQPGACGDHAQCTNTPGSFDCACVAGYFGAPTSGTPATCTLDDKCTAAPCGPLATCQTQGATFACECRSGYQGAPTTGAPPSCADVDECQTGGLCGANALCTNLPGTWACSCAPGFAGSAVSGGPATCVDIDECGAPGVCGANAACTNTPGTFSCACAAGWFGTPTIGQPTSCAAVDHCGPTNPCGANATCANQASTYACECNAGFDGGATTGSPATCVDVDECATTPGCGPNATCTNTPGSYACACNTGYTGAATDGGPTSCVPTILDLGAATGGASTYPLVLKQPVAAGTQVYMLVTGAASGVNDPQDPTGTKWTQIVSNSGCGSCGVTALYKTTLSAGLDAGQVVTVRVSINHQTTAWAFAAPAFPYLDQTMTPNVAGATANPNATVTMGSPPRDTTELLVGAFGTESLTVYGPDAGYVATSTFTGNNGAGIIEWKVASGLSAPAVLSATNSAAQRSSAVFAAFYGGAQQAPTALALSHVANSRGVSLSWAAGRGNGGAGGCQAQVKVSAGTWSPLTPTLNCDAAATSVSASLPAATNWYGATWSSTQVRLVRVSDGVVLGTFATPVTCAAKATSTVATPTVDENCNGTWDDKTCTNWSWVSGTTYTAPTYTMCTNSTGYTAAATTCTATLDGTNRYTDGAVGALSPAQGPSSNSFGIACTGSYTGATTWTCTGSGCTYR